jgi:hypothetical protein
MSATNALAKSVHRTITPELRTSTSRSSSRREEALINLLHGNSPFKMPARKPESFHLKLKCLALYQVLTKNFAEIPEISEMLKCGFGS